MEFHYVRCCVAINLEDGVPCSVALVHLYQASVAAIRSQLVNALAVAHLYQASGIRSQLLDSLVAFENI